MRNLFAFVSVVAISSASFGCAMEQGAPVEEGEEVVSSEAPAPESSAVETKAIKPGTAPGACSDDGKICCYLMPDGFMRCFGY
jgi:hypothetical protein